MLDKEMVDVIKELQNLKEAGVLTEKEFEREKREILKYNTKSTRWLTSLTDFLKVGIWPFIVVFLIVAFYNPLKEQLSKTTEIGAAGFYMKVQATAKDTGNEELASILQGLTKEALQALLQLGEKQMKLVQFEESQNAYHLPLQAVQSYQELEQDGLLTVSELSEPPQEMGQPTGDSVSKQDRPALGPDQKGRDITLKEEDETSLKSVQQGEETTSETLSLEEFLTYFNELPGEYHKRPGRHEEMYVVKRANLSAEEIKRISTLQVGLSEEGLKAFNIIVDTVIGEISSE